MADWDKILTFWLEEVEPEQWYNSTPELDAAITERFEPLWHDAMSGRLRHWITNPKGALAFLLLTDQFPRNMFRDNGQAFASDALARSVAKGAIERGLDVQIDPPARQFFYLPLEHSESLADQERAVRLIATRMPESRDTLLLHARVHREIIRMFGRFPYRNGPLGRMMTAAEQAFVEEGGYGNILQEFQAKVA